MKFSALYGKLGSDKPLAITALVLASLILPVLGRPVHGQTTPPTSLPTPTTTSIPVPDADLLLDRMQTALHQAGSTHLSLQLILSVPHTRQSLLTGYADISSRHNRAHWKESIRVMAANGPLTSNAQAETIDVTRYRAMYVSHSPWICTVQSHIHPVRYDLTIGLKVVSAVTVRSALRRTIPVWEVSATVTGPEDTHGKVTYFIAQSDFTLVRLVERTSEGPAGQPRLKVSGTIDYSRYGERVSPQLPTTCHYRHIDPAGLRPFTVEGEAMVPTLRSGQAIWVNARAYRHRLIKRGDIVVFHGFPGGPITEPDRYFVKRVIGLPGERIAIHHRAVYVNGRRLREPYVHRPASYTFPARLVPSGHYFVLGDNRNNSFDSHLWL